MEKHNAASGVAAHAPVSLHAPNNCVNPALVTIGEAGSGRLSIRDDSIASTAGEPLRKRARTEDVRGAFCMMNSDLHGLEATDLMKDEKYYFEDGDCVIQVEDMLFKVHRFLLARDSSAFQHMFSMPGQENEPNTVQTEGSSDERPIILQCESAANFRALLSVMYALPAELHLYTTHHAQIPTLLTIAQTTNKYHFHTTEQWAVSALYTVLTSKTPPQKHYDLAHCKPSLLRRVVEVALLCQHEELRDFAVGQWMQRILAREINPLGAMAVADEFGLRQLKGVSYYVMLLECGDDLKFDAASFSADNSDSDTKHLSQDGNVSPVPTPSSSDPMTLTPAQKACLLSGHYSLTRLWHRISRNAPAFEKPPGCTYHGQGCVSTWRAVWGSAARSEMTLKHCVADVLGRLRSLEAKLVADADLQCALTPACRRAAMESVRALGREVRDGLADHFVDVTR